jgi:hypothetical protein
MKFSQTYYVGGSPHRFTISDFNNPVLIERPSRDCVGADKWDRCTVEPDTLLKAFREALVDLEAWGEYDQRSQETRIQQDHKIRSLASQLGYWKRRALQVESKP